MEPVSSHIDDPPSQKDPTTVSGSARIAIYDDLKSAPRIVEIKPTSTPEYIESLASKVYEHAQQLGGSMPYTVIREVSENLIHAQFLEIVVSIYDKGNTIRFSDQGPGIENKEKALLPGYTSATESMKQYIRGVGSGFPLVKEYLNVSQGTITIEDNLKNGAVITLSLVKNDQHKNISPLIPPLNKREKEILPFFLHEGALGVTDLARLADFPQSSTHSILLKLEQYGIIEKTAGQKRILTEFGYQVATSL